MIVMVRSNVFLLVLVFILGTSPLIQAQEVRFEMVDIPESVSLEIGLPESDQKGYIPLGRFTQNPAEVMDQFTFQQDDRFYAILSVGFPSRGEYTATGMCASGSEEIFVFVSFNDAFSDVHHQVYAGGSCLRQIYPSIMQDGTYASQLSDLSPDFQQVTIGIETEDEAWSYTLSKAELATGLVKSTTE